MSAPKPAKLRCAVYTRKSSDEGLEQNFNSLHAQREACEAYIQSQTHEGWTLVKGQYDDGGFSGGTMERPALKRLLADVEGGLVDTIVVYKVDRLTRSLHDFAKIVDVFDKAGASFVSITQAFNTTTSMGRLTLNVLLSFAQFEREVTGERIRDKIAQSKAKGMWMGGNLPLGYDAGDHTLVVNEAEAETVRMIFRRYLELGSVYALEADLEQRGVRSKVMVSKGGTLRGGAPLSRGALYHLLQNRHYIGKIPHKDQTFEGLHPPIVEGGVFESVQALLKAHRIEYRAGASGISRAPLRGKIFDGEGGAYTPTFSTGRGGKVYRYYIGQKSKGEAPGRIPAEPLEAFLIAQARRFAASPNLALQEFRDGLQRIEVRGAGLQVVLAASMLFGGSQAELVLGELTGRLAVGERAVIEAGGQAVRISLPIRMAFRGGRTWVTGGEARSGMRGRKPDKKLVRALREAHAVLNKLGASPLAREGRQGCAQAPANTYLTRLARLAFLAPDLQVDILCGRQPEGLTLKVILAADAPLDWSAQRRWIREL